MNQIFKNISVIFENIMNIILLGKPGCGKGTQSRLLMQNFGFAYLSTGDIIRAEMVAKTPLGLQMKEATQNGGLVDDQTILELVAKHLQAHDKVLLDGFPRTIVQAQELDKRMKIDAVLHIDITDEEALYRLTKRWMVNLGGEQISFKSQDDAEKFAHVNGGEVFHRKDDNPQIAVERLEVYHKQTEPLLAYYAGKIKRVQGHREIEITYSLVCDALGLM
jgi:adenylate kinase